MMEMQIFCINQFALINQEALKGSYYYLSFKLDSEILEHPS